MRRPFLWVAIALILMGTAAVGVLAVGMKSANDAQTQHEAVYSDYRSALRAVERSSFTVYEGGHKVGTYTFEELGLREGLETAVKNAYSALDRLEPAAFAELSIREKRDWIAAGTTPPREYAVPLDALTLAPVLEDLADIPRTQPVDAHIEQISGVYSVTPEIPGNTLREDVVIEELRDCFAGQTYKAGWPLELSCEITDQDCYVKPEIDAAEMQSRLETAARRAWDQMQIDVSFARMDPDGAAETIGREELRRILSIDDQGGITMNSEAVDEIVAGWAQKYNVQNVPFLFDSYVKGYTPLDFIQCSYELDQQALSDQLRTQILSMQSASLEAPVFCYGEDGEQLFRDETWIEVDIDNQQLTYFKNGELILNTDIVTGALYNGHMTPTGLYDTHHKQTEIWLVGEDYTVFVHYWIGVIGEMIGLHDAEWRENFGGENYSHNGSHGCINMPVDAIASIFDIVDDGTPVIIHGHNRYFVPYTGNSDATPNPLRGTTAAKAEE